MRNARALVVTQSGMPTMVIESNHSFQPSKNLHITLSFKPSSFQLFKLSGNSLKLTSPSKLASCAKTNRVSLFASKFWSFANVCFATFGSE